MSTLRLWTAIKWIAAVVGLVVGVVCLYGFWTLFYDNARVRSKLGWGGEVAFWSAMPPIEAGLLIGYVLGNLPSGESRRSWLIARFPRLLLIGIWGVTVVNFIIELYFGTPY